MVRWSIPLFDTKLRTRLSAVTLMVVIICVRDILNMRVVVEMDGIGRVWHVVDPIWHCMLSDVHVPLYYYIDA